MTRSSRAIRRRASALLFFGTLLVTTRAAAISVVAPSFEELVGEADRIVVGQVVNVEARWITRAANQFIVTTVTVSNDRVLKGASGLVTVLEFLGGTVGDTTLTVPGLPAFSRGERAVLFVRAQANAVSPLVGMMHGRFRVNTTPDGRQRVTTHDGLAFAGTQQLGNIPASSPRAIQTMALGDFERAIVEAVRRGAQR